MRALKLTAYVRRTGKGKTNSDSIHSACPLGPLLSAEPLSISASKIYGRLDFCSSEGSYERHLPSNLRILCFSS
jgi:hypothetical protein